MFPKPIKFFIPRKPTTLNFVRPVCTVAHRFCWLLRKDALSVADLLILQEIGEKIGFKIFLQKNERIDGITEYA